MQIDANNINIDDEQQTTIKIKNIKRSLTSELIYLILEKKFHNKKAYNAIYTTRKQGHIKNAGTCYINFSSAKYISELYQILNEFKRKNERIVLEYSETQGRDFIEMMMEERKKSVYLDFIIF